MNNKIFLLFSHVLTAEEVWLCRVKGLQAPTQRLWQIYQNDTLQQMLEDNSRNWQDHLETCSQKDLSRTIEYKNTKGESFTTRLEDIVTHLVNHGSHHRAQVASLLQQEKIQPPISDYIVYVREQSSPVAVI